MRPSVVLEAHRFEVRATVARFPVTNPRVFGSVARGSDLDGSDIDLLVDALPGATLFHLVALQDELESLLGVPVDVRTPGDLPISFRARVVAESWPLGWLAGDRM